ncbi:DNA-processing protein DprA [Natronorubrum tibetense]|uniref:DNA protecting protein DprA n=1 Tax=Natronorubrum tibetense GA33 TaxID=1114856 RepID=L9VS83_9EURY|nr:DNA-processing protein DprA [Natronorubrum tibetense]ELY39857.1 DNA protecting protein DprA [Natronorubrum tibetense GA33]
MEIDNLASLVALTDVDGVGDKRALKLYRAVETPEELWSSSLTAFDDFHYVDEETHTQLQNLPETIDNYRERFDRYRNDGIKIIGIDDDRYPASLRRNHAPLVLYAKGNVDLLNGPAVSVSGSRETNEAGQHWTREIACELAAEGYTIVSGGARGADTAAHEGALDATGETIVVLGTGVDIPYPEENKALFSDIVDTGGLLLSHQRPNAGPTRHSFLNRNPTISALSPGIIVVATDGTGGTMAQYDIAVEQNRRIFVPKADRDIRPDNGLRELRTAKATTVVSSTASVEAKLVEAVPGDEAKPGDTDGFEEQANQTCLDDWG